MTLENSIKSIVDTLKLFDEGFTSVKRNPVDLGVRVKSLSEFIECRFNFELFKLPEFKSYEELMDGYLFKVSCILNEGFRSYERITLEINDEKPEFLSDDSFRSIIRDVEELIGGKYISFSSDRKNLDIQYS